MTWGATIILATQVVTLLAAIASLWSSRKNKASIQEVHVALNSRLTELLKMTASASHAEGVKAEKDHPT